MAIKQKTKSLKSRKEALHSTFIQLEVLSDQTRLPDGLPSFTTSLSKHGYDVLKPTNPTIFQINIGKLCNQSCAHCHVDAGPDRKEENMDRTTLETCLAIIKKHHFKTVDITGGAPEMNPNFRWFIESLSALDVEIIVRCNLTIIVAHEKYYDLPVFFAKHNVYVVSSLPYFSKSRTDAQRGDGVFEDSIRALLQLNKVGYGQENSDLKLDLVYNPSGTFLPGDQTSLESEFKRQLDRKYGIHFNNLLVITNLPISRFLDYLLEQNRYSDYMTQLIEAFNPAVVPNLMCRNTLSVSWDGYIYDCDFNQMLDLKVSSKSLHISSFNYDDLLSRSILINNHCYGCTAGSGSSCGGEIA